MLLLNMYTKNFEKEANPDCKLVYNENQFIEKEGQRILVECINYYAYQGQVQ